MGLSPEEVRRVRLSALLHDVGKIGIDDRILRKPTALTDEEFEIMKAHPVKGAAIMEAIPQLARRHPGDEAPPREVGGRRLSRTASRARRSRCRRASCRSPTRSTR